MHDVKKEEWILSVEMALKAMMKDKEEMKIKPKKLRHPSYLNQSPVYQDLTTVFEREVVSSDNAFAPRTSHQNIGAMRARNMEAATKRDQQR